MLRRHHRTSAGELTRLLGVSRPTLMRAVRSAGADVLTIGRTRRTSYAARRLLRGHGAPVPLFRIDEAGRPSEVGRLHLAHPDGTWLEGEALAGWPRDADMGDGWFEGIPYPLQDMRPEGFLGRAFARLHGALLQVPDDPTRWSDDDALHALSLMGTDPPGGFILGETAYRLWLAHRTSAATSATSAISDTRLPSAYAALAAQSMQQGVAGSSAGGEFPKFTALRKKTGRAVHVLVKFSGSDASPGTRRWADLLVCEHLALDVAAQRLGLAAAVSQVHQSGGRTFLEVERFDRHGEFGRSAVCSWAAFNHDWFGTVGRPWIEGASLLRGRGLINAAVSDAIARQWHYGQLIGNTDMHDGNLSFVPAAQELRPTPMYDMLPMLYAPQRGVELPVREFVPRAPLPSEQAAWMDAADAAIAFWGRAAVDRRISTAFRKTCALNAEAVERTRRVFG